MILLHVGSVLVEGSDLLHDLAQLLVAVFVQFVGEVTETGVVVAERAFASWRREGEKGRRREGEKERRVRMEYPEFLFPIVGWCLIVLKKFYCGSERRTNPFRKESRR